MFACFLVHILSVVASQASLDLFIASSSSSADSRCSPADPCAYPRALSLAHTLAASNLTLTLTSDVTLSPSSSACLPSYPLLKSLTISSPSSFALANFSDAAFCASSFPSLASLAFRSLRLLVHPSGASLTNLTADTSFSDCAIAAPSNCTPVFFRAVRLGVTRCAFENVCVSLSDGVASFALTSFATGAMAVASFVDSALYTYNTNLTITNCSFSRLQTHGVTAFAGFVLIANSTFRHVTFSAVSVPGSGLYPGALTVANCEFFNISQYALESSRLKVVVRDSTFRLCGFG